MAVGSEEKIARSGEVSSTTTDASVSGTDNPGAGDAGTGPLPVSEAATEAAVAPDVDDIPNGGLKAWLQVVGCFAIFFNSWGIVNTFGVFQTYYESNLLRDSTPAAISWIGSVQGALLLGGGGLSGPLFDAGYFRALIATGTALVCFGFMMTSLASQYWHVLLGQGFCVGLGAGCLVTPALAVLPQYFGPSRRALAVGVSVVGSSIGGVVYPLVFNGVISRIGFPWTSRLFGFISLATCAVAVAVMRTRVKPRRVRSLFDPKAFREPPGGIVSLPPVVLTSITEDLSFLGARMGTMFMFNAAGSLCGPPIAGTILRARNGDYLGLQLFGAAAISGTALCALSARVARAGPRLAVKNPNIGT
ncbi:hypothetical protein MAPG_01298 [Magnaporthiopsis poae ATCC 64411]|uniref:Major facilitator superfamily (MFS) profile domain-containing protein n=1 Tax=Magnaporthiopsis poae (strain ATCC 64411 / 73-15) TaxID=644358 RepID=A0A0C4DNB7_MAGP6|nr:hypothetical protein MAPG_01298 [Magnaporthiopsis poae ATCC 64411]